VHCSLKGARQGTGCNAEGRRDDDDSLMMYDMLNKEERFL